MTHTTFCSSPSCRLHGYQVLSSVNPLRVLVYDAPDRLTPPPNAEYVSYKEAEFRRVWFQTIDGSRFSLCEDCARAGRIDQVPAPDLYVAICRGAATFQATRGKKPQYVAMGRADYVDALDSVHRRGLSYECRLTSSGEEYAGLEVVLLDSPAGLFVF